MTREEEHNQRISIDREIHKHLQENPVAYRFMAQGGSGQYQEITERMSEQYRDGREKMHEHMKEVFSAYRGAERQDQKIINSVAEGHREAIQTAAKEGMGRYSDPQYVAGSQAGLRDWQREEQREAERQTVRIKVA